VKRHLLTALLALLVASLAFCVASALRLRPWELVVPFREDPATDAEDRVLVARGLEQLAAPAAVGPDVVIIVLDTVRPDHLELYGYEHDTMPLLTAWARHGRVHERALSTSSWTLPAHASLFTGQHSVDHGAHGRTVEPGHFKAWATGRRTTRVLERKLAPRAVTLAERLWDAGYATLAVASNRAFLDTRWNLHQGFDLWICEQPRRGRSRLPYLRADRVTNMALEAVDRALPALDWPEQEGRAPLFLFLNYMDAHGPMVPREGYVRDPSRLVFWHRTGRRREQLAWSVLAQEQELPPEVRAGWTEAYEAELRFMDEQIHRLLVGLEDRGIGDDAYIVVLSDHGEYFGEHQLLAHSKDVYQPGLEIALLERGPGVRPGRSAEPVQILDVPGWVLQRTAAEALPAAESSGDLLVAELYGSRSRDLRNKRFGQRFNRVRRSFQSGERKVILGSDGSFEAYDLDADPAELEDLSSQDWARQLRAQAVAWMEERSVDDAALQAGAGDGEQLEEDQIDALKALGYMD